MKGILGMLLAGAVGVVGAWADELDVSSAESAASVVLASLSERVAQGDDAEKPIMDKMSADSARYANRHAAEEELVGDYSQILSDEFAKKCNDVLERLARPRKMDEVFSKSYVQRVNDDFRETLADTVERNYRKVFNDARNKACEAQRSGLSAGMYPTEEEVDTRSPAELKNMLTERLAKNQKCVVFDENKAWISDAMSAPIVDDALKERRLQHESLSRMDEDGWSPDVVKENLVASLKEKIGKRRQKAAAENKHAYGLFPSSLEHPLNNAVERIVMGHISARIMNTPVKVDDAGILDAIDKNISDGDLKERFEKAFVKAACDTTAEAVAKDAPEGERVKFADYVREHNSSRVIANAARGKVEKDLYPSYARARTTKAAQLSDTEKCAKALKNDLQKKLEATHKKPEVDEIEKMLATDVGKAWKAEMESRIGVNEGDELYKVYEPLLQSVLNRIKELAKLIFDELKEPEKEEPPPPPPEEELLKLPCEVELDKRGCDINLTLVIDGHRIEVGKCDASEHGFRKSFEKLDREGGEKMLQFLMALHPAKGSSLETTLSVKDEFIYYGAVERATKLLNVSANAAGFKVNGEAGMDNGR